MNRINGRKKPKFMTLPVYEFIQRFLQHVPDPNAVLVRRHHRSGHLFQGRYKSIIIENDAYLLQLSFYIHSGLAIRGSATR